MRCHALLYTIFIVCMNAEYRTALKIYLKCNCGLLFLRILFGLICGNFGQVYDCVMYSMCTVGTYCIYLTVIFRLVVR